MGMYRPRPTVCSLVLVDAVIAERQGGANAAFFNGLASEWRERVRAYIERAGSPEFVPRWPKIEPRKRTFLNLYLSRQKGSAQKIVITEMLHGPELNHCPACGEPGTPTTLDHSLPKRRDPPFRVTPLTCFPMLEACQQGTGGKKE